MTLLSDAEIEERLATLDGWRRDVPSEGSGAGGAESIGGAAQVAIVRDLTFGDFSSAITFVDRVAELAEQANHHPNILVHGWNRVRLTLSTHSEGGLTAADFELAAGIDRLA